LCLQTSSPPRHLQHPILKHLQPISTGTAPKALRRSVGTNASCACEDVYTSMYTAPDGYLWLYMSSCNAGAGGAAAPDLEKFGAEVERLQQAAQEVEVLCTHTVRTGALTCTATNDCSSMHHQRMACAAGRVRCQLAQQITLSLGNFCC
jgi:hypothetical protein